MVLAGILFRLWILEGTLVSVGGTTFYYREIVRGMEERGEFGLYPYRHDAFTQLPQITRDTTPLMERIDKSLADYGIDVSSDSRLMEWTPLIRYPPGFPIFLYAAQSVLGDKAKRVMILIAVLNGLMIALTFPVAWMLFRRRDIAWTSTVLNAFWIFTAKNAVNYDPASLLIPLIMLTVYVALKAWHTGEWKWVIALSGLTFIDANLRTDTVFLSLFLPISFFFRTAPLRDRVLKAAAAAFIAGVLWVPWCFYNLNHFGIFHPFPTNAGHNIMIAIGKFAPESGLPADDFQTAVQEYGADHVKQGLWVSDVTYPNGMARDKVRMARSKAWIREHPWRFVETMFTRLPCLFFTETNAIHMQLRTKLHGLPAGLVDPVILMVRFVEPLALLLGVAGIWIFRARPVICVPVLLLLAYILPHMPLWVESRYFKAAWPIVLILATAGVLSFRRKIL